MEKQLLFITFLLMASICAAKVYRFTADFYTINAEKYLDKEAKVYAFAADFTDNPRFAKEGYRALIVKTFYTDKHGGEIVVLVPAKEAFDFKDKYSGIYDDAQKLSSILRRTPDEKRTLYIQCGNLSPAQKEQTKKEKKNTKKRDAPTYSTDYYDLMAEEFIGKKVTFKATSAALDQSARFDYIPNNSAFIVETPNAKIQNEKLYVVVPKKHVN